VDEIACVKMQASIDHLKDDVHELRVSNLTLSDLAFRQATMIAVLYGDKNEIGLIAAMKIVERHTGVGDGHLPLVVRVDAVEDGAVSKKGVFLALSIIGSISTLVGLWAGWILWAGKVMHP
jgi:hypothetical protein